MDKKDTAKIIDILQTIYPDGFKQMSKEGIITAINVWAAIFADDPLEEVQAAVLAHIATDTSRFMPTPGVIKQTIVRNRDHGGLTEAEAWALVHKAIRKSALHAQEEYDRLPGIVQRTVGSPAQLYEWAITEDLNTAVISSNFMRSYKVRRQQEQDEAALPQSVKALLGKCSDRLRLEERT